MKWYHFGMFLLLIFLTFAITEHSSQLQLQQSTKIWENDYRCLVQAVDAATKKAFDMGNVTEEATRSQVSRVYFDTLSLLQGEAPFLLHQADDFGKCIAEKQTVCLILLEADGFYFCAPALGDMSFGPKVTFEGAADKREQIANTLQDCVSRYVALQNGTLRKYKSASAEEGSWERSLGNSGILAVYASNAPVSASEQGLRFLYAAAKPVQETYLVTEDGKCHQINCPDVDATKVVQTCSSLLSAVGTGAEYCESCLMWNE